jgi:hypothetical protein
MPSLSFISFAADQNTHATGRTECCSLQILFLLALSSTSFTVDQNAHATENMKKRMAV